MTDGTQHWVINTQQNVIYNSAAPSKCLSSFGDDSSLRMLQCKGSEINWMMKEGGLIQSVSNPMYSLVGIGFGYSFN